MFLIGSLLIALILLVALPRPCSSLSTPPPLTRKQFIRTSVPLILLAAAPPSPAHAAVGKLVEPPSTEAALARFTSSRETLDSLLSQYPAISAKGGDEIRRYLGTVGTASPLLGIRTTLKVLQDSADDIVEYTEAMDDFDRHLASADQEAYSSMFVEFSAAKGKPEDFYERARKDVEVMVKQLNIMANEIK